MSHVPPDPRPQTHSSAFTSVASGPRREQESRREEEEGGTRNEERGLAHPPNGSDRRRDSQVAKVLS